MCVYFFHTIWSGGKNGVIRPSRQPTVENSLIETGFVMAWFNKSIIFNSFHLSQGSIGPPMNKWVFCSFEIIWNEKEEIIDTDFFLDVLLVEDLFKEVTSLNLPQRPMSPSMNDWIPAHPKPFEMNRKNGLGITQYCAVEDSNAWCEVQYIAW